MPTVPRSTLLASAAINNLPKRLNAVNLAAVQRARQFRAQGTVTPQTQAKAAQLSQDVVARARLKAVAQRTPAALGLMGQQKLEMAAAHQRIKAIFSSRNQRSPAQVISAFLTRAQQTNRRLQRGDMASLLIRSKHKSVASFNADLAKALGLASAADIATARILVRQVSPRQDDRGAVYSIRLPVKRSTVTTEIHNFAWALRKSNSFTSVRPDGLRKMLLGTTLSAARRAERVFAWPLLLTKALEAHSLPPQPGGRAQGEGIIIAHPDTGWAPHPQYNQQNIDVAQSFNAATGVTGGQAARHSARLSDAGVPNISHGTATGSVMVGGAGAGTKNSLLLESNLQFPLDDNNKRKYGGDKRVVDLQGALTGVAPRAQVRPIKFIDDVAADIDRSGLNGIGVVRIADEDLVTALDYARTSGAHVVSLSIGGLMHDAVRDAIDLAVQNNLIIVAAAGQTYAMSDFNNLSQAAAGMGIPVGDTVVLLAAYANVIAVAGCSPDGRPWDESLRGPNVDITAPADAMWVADFDSKQSNNNGDRLPLIEAGSGTSFAAAFMAGVAALWLAHWGRAQLLQRYPGTPLAWVFRHQLQLTANAAHANDWDKVNYGPGVVNVRALLEAPLPNAQDVMPPPATTANLFTVVSGTLSSPVVEAIGDAWAVIYDVGSRVAGTAAQLGDAAWAASRAVAEGVIQAGRQALEDLYVYADSLGNAVDQATQQAIDEVTGFVETAADAAEDAAQAAADAGQDAVDAVVDFVEDTADTVGEAAEDVADFLFGWAS